MSSQAKTLSVAILLLGLLVALWAGGSSAWWSPEGRPETDSPPSRPAPQAEVDLVRPAGVARSQDPAPATTEPPAEHGLPYEFDVSLLVLNADDVPARRAGVSVAPLGLPLHRGRTDKKGRLQLRIRGRRPTMDLAVSVGDSGRIVHRLRVLADQPAVRTFRTDERAPRRAVGTFAFVLHTASTVQQPELQIDDEGWCQFSVGSAPADPPGRGDGPDFVLHGVDLDFSGLAGGLRGTPVVTYTPSEGLRIEDSSVPSESFLEGVIYDANGSPAADALVCAGEDDWQWTERTDAEGKYRMQVPAGTWRVRAGGGAFGVAVGKVSVAKDSTAQWAPRLERGAEVMGSLVDEDQAGLGGWRLDLRSADGTWVDRTETAADGSFAVPNCPPERLVVEATHAEGGLPSHSFYTVPGARGVHTVPASATARATVTTRPSPASAVGPANVALWLWLEDRAQVLEVGEDGSIRGTVSPGVYVVELRGRLDTEPLPLGGHALLPAQVLDLGEVALPAPAMLTLDGGSWADAEWVYQHPDVDARAALQIGDAQVVLPGTWRARREGGQRTFEINRDGLALGEADAPR